MCIGPLFSDNFGVSHFIPAFFRLITAARSARENGGIILYIDYVLLCLFVMFASSNPSCSRNFFVVAGVV
jgi:hypothetical protein